MSRWSAVGVLGVSRRGVDQPDGVFVVIDGVADAAAAGYLVFPLFHVTAVVPVPCQVAAEPMLAVVVCPDRGSARRISRQRRVFASAWRHSSSQPAAASLEPNRTSYWPSGGGTVTRSPRRGLTR